MAQHSSAAGELARALSRHAEAVCRHYLSAGRRCGHYWTVGDVANSPGRSLYVRLTGPVSGKGTAGRWCDAATGEYGDLLDLFALTSGFGSLRNAMDEARAFLALPRPEPKPISDAGQVARSRETVETARRGFRSGQPLRGTTAERYLENHGLSIADVDTSALRFHPGAYYRETSESPRQTWPALLAKVTDRGWHDHRHRSCATREGADQLAASGSGALGRKRGALRSTNGARASVRRGHRNGAVPHSRPTPRRHGRGTLGHAPRPTRTAARSCDPPDRAGQRPGRAACSRATAPPGRGCRHRCAFGASAPDRLQRRPSPRGSRSRGGAGPGAGCLS